MGLETAHLEGSENSSKMVQKVKILDGLYQQIIGGCRDGRSIRAPESIHIKRYDDDDLTFLGKFRYF